MSNTAIEWTDKVWNPVTGCTKVSQGCKNCYAERVFPRPYPGRAFTDVRTHEDRLEDPLHWRRPARIFVNSMSDLFHEAIPDAFIQAIFAVMARCPQHTFQVLTKRPARMLNLMTQWQSIGLTLREGCGAVLQNVWLGISCEDQATADERIPLLLQTPAAVRWASAEPLLGPIELTSFEIMGHYLDALRGEWCSKHTTCLVDDKGDAKLDWVVLGGESGPGARPMHPDWARSLRDQCQAATVPFFFKQWGEWQPVQYTQGATPFLKISVPAAEKARPSTREIVMHSGSPESGVNLVRVGKKAAGRELDGREWNEYPEVKA